MSQTPTPLITPIASPPIARRDIPSALMAAVVAAFTAGYMVSYVLWRISPDTAAYAGSIGFHLASLIKSGMDIAGIGYNGFAMRYLHATQQVGWSAVWRVGITYASVLITGIYTFKALAVEINPIKHLRGRQLISGKAASVEAVQEANSENAGSEPGIEIILGSNLRISQDRETKHFFIVGGTGSGKTVAASHLLVQAIARKDRVLLIDYKGLTEKCPGAVVIADPTDERGALWDIAADIRTIWDAEECAARMIPASGNNPFWADGSRAILAGLMASLIHEKPNKWGFNDLAALISMPAEQYSEIMLKHYPQALSFVANPDSNATDSLIKSMSVVCKFIFQLAAAEKSNTTGKRISFRDWIQNPNHPDRTIILKINDAFAQLSASYNQAILGVIGSRVSSLKDVPPHINRVWIIADEFPKLNKVMGWSQFLSVGRSKSMRIVTIVQSVSQLRETFGEHETDTWTSIVGSMILGKNDGATAKWYCDIIGEKEVWTPARSVSLSAGGYTTTNSYSRERLPVLLPSQCSADLGLMNGSCCKSIFYGFKNAHILTWRFLNENDGWSNQRADYIPAIWTQSTTISDTNFMESGSNSNLNTSAINNQTNKLQQKFIEEEYDVNQRQDEIFISDNKSLNDLADESNLSDKLSDSLAEHVIDDAATMALGADAHGLGQLAVLADELLGANNEDQDPPTMITPPTLKKRQYMSRKAVKNITMAVES